MLIAITEQLIEPSLNASINLSGSQTPIVSIPYLQYSQARVN